MVFVFSSCSLCLPDLFTYPIFRGARAIVVLQSYVGLQSPWEPHRRRCFLSRNVGKNMPLATFGPECYSSHPFLWNFRSFLTCISRWAVASRIEKWKFQLHTGNMPEFFQTVDSGFGEAISYPQKRWWSVLCFVPMQTVIGQNSCGMVSSKRLGTKFRKMMSSPSYSTPHDTLESKKQFVYVNIWYLHSLKTTSLPLKIGLPAPKSRFHLYNHPFSEANTSSNSLPSVTSSINTSEQHRLPSSRVTEKGR